MLVRPNNGAAPSARQTRPAEFRKLSKISKTCIKREFTKAHQKNIIIQNEINGRTGAYMHPRTSRSAHDARAVHRLNFRDRGQNRQNHEISMVTALLGQGIPCPESTNSKAAKFACHVAAIATDHPKQSCVNDAEVVTKLRYDVTRHQ